MNKGEKELRGARGRVNKQPGREGGRERLRKRNRRGRERWGEEGEKATDGGRG